MSFSLVQIANMALGKVGVSGQIDSLEFSEGESVPNEARLAKLYFELAFRAAAASHDWTCLTKQADISGAVTPSGRLFGYAYAYSLPADFIRLLRMEDEEAGYARRGRLLCTDETDVKIEYIHYTEDTTLYDPLFTESLVMRWAAHLAPGLLGGADGQAVMDNLLQWHEKVILPSARFYDSGQRSPVTLSASTWKDSRL